MEYKTDKEDIQFDLAGDESTDELNVNADSVHQAVIWGTDWTTETINMQMVKGNIDLTPAFQRRDVWTNQDKSRLIESLILNIPVPPIILAESKTKRNSYIVIDGKQRLLSISRFFGDKSFTPLKLSGLSVLKDLNGKAKDDIPIEQLRDLENQTIRTIIIRNWPDEAFLYTVFLRLNTGSKKLSPQELRQALKPGNFLSYLDNATADSTAMKKMLNNKKADPRMKDIELALRYFAFKYYITSFNGSLKTFLDKACDELNKRWDEESDLFRTDFAELEKAIEAAYSIIGNNTPFSRFERGESSGRFNRSIYELFSYYLSDESIRLRIIEKQSEFLNKFIALNDDPDFVSAISDTTKDPIKVVTRFSMFAKILISILHTDILSFEIVDNRIVLSKVRG